MNPSCVRPEENVGFDEQEMRSPSITPTRRAMVGGAMIASASALSPAAIRGSRFAAIAFDAFAVFDPRPIASRAENFYPGRGAALMELWRSRQFEYAWLRSLSGRYTDFMHVTEDALVFAARALGLPLSSDIREGLLQPYLGLGPWPDAAPVLRRLKAAGVRLALLSNFTPPMLAGAIGTAGLDGVFEQAISTDSARTYKPDRRAYRLGVDALALPREQILFASFAGWDAAGAKAFGYPTFWVNRMRSPPEELGAQADGVGYDLAELAAFAVI